MTSLSQRPNLKNPREPGRTGPPGNGRGRSPAFIATGIAAIAFTAVATPLGAFDRLPVVANVQGAVGDIAILALTISLWMVLFVLFRLFGSTSERSELTLVRNALGASRAAGSLAELCRFLISRLPASSGRVSLIRRRLDGLAKADTAEPGQATAAMAAHAELDHAHNEVSYGPARALVWALPALGFLGTAAEMAQSVNGLSRTISATTDYTHLRDALVSNVIPPLVNAFGVTLLALGAGVVCHLLLTWTNAREQRILLDVEDVTLDVLSASATLSTPPVTSTGPAMLDGQVRELTQELSTVRQTMAQAASQVSAMDLTPLNRVGTLAEIGPMLQSVDHRLQMIHAELAQDIVIRRQRPSSAGS